MGRAPRPRARRATCPSADLGAVRRGGVLPRRRLRPTGDRQRGAERPAGRAGARRARVVRRPLRRGRPDWCGRPRATTPTATPTAAVLLDADLAVLGSRARGLPGLRHRRARRVRPPRRRGVAHAGEPRCSATSSARRPLYATRPARARWEARARRQHGRRAGHARRRRADRRGDRSSRSVVMRTCGASPLGEAGRRGAVLPRQRRPTRRTRTGISAGAGTRAATAVAAAVSAASTVRRTWGSVRVFGLRAKVFRPPAIVVDWNRAGARSRTTDHPPAELVRSPRRSSSPANRARPHRQGRAGRVGGRQGARGAHLRHAGRGAVRARVGAVARSRSSCRCARSASRSTRCTGRSTTTCPTRRRVADRSVDRRRAADPVRRSGPSCSIPPTASCSCASSSRRSRCGRRPAAARSPARTTRRRCAASSTRSSALTAAEIGPHIWTRLHIIPFLDGRWDGQRDHVYLVRTDGLRAAAPPDVGAAARRAASTSCAGGRSPRSRRRARDVVFAPAATARARRRPARRRAAGDTTRRRGVTADRPDSS